MKKALLTLSVLFVLGLFATANAQIQSGNFYFDSSNPAYTLNKNEGLRTVQVEVNFTKPFDVKPKVVLATTVLDAAKNTQLRYSLEATSVSRDGFVIKVSVWQDTQLNSIGGSWIAHVEE